MNVSTEQRAMRKMKQASCLPHAHNPQCNGNVPHAIQNCEVSLEQEAPLLWPTASSLPVLIIAGGPRWVDTSSVVRLPYTSITVFIMLVRKSKIL